jgi:hypothetical protein
MTNLADALFAKVLLLGYEGKTNRDTNRFADHEDLRAARERAKKRA